MVHQVVGGYPTWQLWPLGIEDTSPMPWDRFHESVVTDCGDGDDDHLNDWILSRYSHVSSWCHSNVTIVC